MDTSLVDEMFSLQTDSALTEIVPRLSLPLFIGINGEERKTIRAIRIVCRLGH